MKITISILTALLLAPLAAVQGADAALAVTAFPAKKARKPAGRGGDS